MDDNKSYLPFLINEDIYLIPETKSEVVTNTATPTETTPAPVIKTEAVVEQNPTQPSTPVEEVTKKLLVMYHFKPTPALPAPLKKLMLAILQAIKVDIPDADFINTAYKTLPEDVMRYTYVLNFGVTEGLGKQAIDKFPQYAIQKTGQATYLLADDLALLEKDKVRKLKLWNILKEMFAV